VTTSRHGLTAAGFCACTQHAAFPIRIPSHSRHCPVPLTPIPFHSRSTCWLRRWPRTDVCHALNTACCALCCESCDRGWLLLQLWPDCVAMQARAPCGVRFFRLLPHAIMHASNLPCYGCPSPRTVREASRAGQRILTEVPSFLRSNNTCRTNQRTHRSSPSAL
jgi:hypothetical protein